MNFPDYIKERGEEACANAWGVSPRAVKSWRYRERYPRPDQARSIVSETGGSVTLEDIFGEPLKGQSDTPGGLHAHPH